MPVENIINNTGEKFSPYMGGLVNHLPMVQWAIYKLSGDTKRVDKFTREYLETANIDQIKKEYKNISSLDEALGKRDLYEGTLQFLKDQVSTRDIKDMTVEILNKHKLGMSSGLFHTLIRVAYGVEQYNEKSELKDELIRGLAYYITGYREAKIFKREIESENIIKEMENLAKSIHIKEILDRHETLGQRMKALYEDKIYLEKGFIIRGNGDEKIKTLLKLLVPLFYLKGNIVTLHCITSIHAITIVKDYYENFEEAVDILTTCIITHLITTGIDKYPEEIEPETGFSWRCIKQRALKSKDVHDIKLVYSAFRLDEIYNIDELKDISIKRIRHI